MAAPRREIDRSDRARRARLPWAALASVLLLSACAGEQASEAAPRPVLAERVGGEAAGSHGRQFPGEVRARVEQPLAFQVGGRVARRLVDVGDRVARGQVLAELESQDLDLQAGAVRAQLAAAQAEAQRASAERRRLEALGDEQLVSRSTVDAAIAADRAAAGQVRALQAQLGVAGNQAGYATLRAPDDGVVAMRQIEAGQVVAPGQVAFVLAVDSALEAAIALPESDIHAYSVGQPVQVEGWGAPGRRFDGRIREIAPAADPATRTYAARVALPDTANDALSLGQSVRVFAAGSDGDAPTVPLAAVQQGEGDATAVWVVDPGTRRLALRAVRLGAWGETRVPVLEGLSRGDIVVAAGGHLLRADQAVVPVDRDNKPLLATPAASRAEDAE
ncbi:multidrug efflux RND transporter periplasmic adaptor subunit MexJ [Luteimonas pelagia]